MNPIVPALLTSLVALPPLALAPERNAVDLTGARSPSAGSAQPVTPGSSEPSTAADGDDVRAAPRGSAVWPVAPPVEVVRPFEPPATRFGPGHRGVDLAGRPGEVVRSALGGQVVFAGVIAGRGVVTVRHGATRTTYEPVTATVRVGDQVGAGTPIGVLQATRSHCAPACLHWGWLRGETYLDPLDLLGRRPVRLWPWDREGGASTARPAQPLVSSVG